MYSCCIQIDMLDININFDASCLMGQIFYTSHTVPPNKQLKRLATSLK